MGLMRMAARTAVVAGTATAVSGRVAHRQAARYAAEEPQPVQQEYVQQPVQQVYVEPEEPAEDPTIAKIKELASLHSAGILSDAEFEAAKAKALGI